MKTIIRIPGKHQYSYLEVEAPPEASWSQIKVIYDEVYDLINDVDVPTDAFNQYLIRLVDSDLSVWGDVESYNALGQSQKNVVQSIKRLKKRLNYETKQL